MTDRELAKEIWEEIHREHQEPVMRFTLEPGEPGLLESKVGGTPYLSREMPWPVDSAGVPMNLLAQVDCLELAELPDFPHTGLLQFFIACNDVYGLNFEDMTAADGFRVLYHKAADASVTAREVLDKRPPLPEDSECCTPLENGPCRIRFTPAAVQKMSQGDYQFNKLFVEKWNRRRPDALIKYIWEISDDLSSLYEEMDPDQSPWHQMGGYPYFTQTDPRWDGKYPDLDVLLFQLDTQSWEGPPFLVLWGDCGVGNFFINREALKKCDFSRVGYTWDCC